MFECYLWGWCKVTILLRLRRGGVDAGCGFKEDTPNTDRVIGLELG